MKYIWIVAALVLIFAACGDQPSQEVSDDVEETSQAPAEEEYVLPEAEVYLTLSDSIGVEIGDSNYVFGQIAGADIFPGGNIAVLDLQKASVKVYDPSGEYVATMGRKGSGPGEFLLPSGMACFPPAEGEEVPDSLNPGFVVCDAMGGKLSYFDTDLEHLMDVQGFFPSPPAVLAGIGGGAVVGMKPIFEQGEEGTFMGFTIARWELGETDPSVTYFESMSPFNPGDLSTMQDDIVTFGASADGRVLTASLSTEAYEFTLWSPEGEDLFTVVDEDFEMVRKTQEEIDLEAEMVNNRMIQQGMPESMANWEPDPYRSAIAGLWFDGLGRIWVTRGTVRTPYFDVYDEQGEKLFTAALDAGERASQWQVLIKGDRFLAFDADPEMYPQLFIGDIPGAGDVQKEEDFQETGL
ncbi:MAG: hypothetical protein GF388_03390 [Candidatus Aegiribacteria sp.]|nr:hypothetical protein [Candidatus Aegiribacteria sp.]MBD3294308.1 hypothetical protein [Candidatus Fermentibacteria bacterium]